MGGNFNGSHPGIFDAVICIDNSAEDSSVAISNFLSVAIANFLIKISAISFVEQITSMSLDVVQCPCKRRDKEPTKTIAGCEYPLLTCSIISSVFLCYITKRFWRTLDNVLRDW